MERSTNTPSSGAKTKDSTGLPGTIAHFQAILSFPLFAKPDISIKKAAFEKAAD